MVKVGEAGSVHVGAAKDDLRASVRRRKKIDFNTRNGGGGCSRPRAWSRSAVLPSFTWERVKLGKSGGSRHFTPLYPPSQALYTALHVCMPLFAIFRPVLQLRTHAADVLHMYIGGYIVARTPRASRPSVPAAPSSRPCSAPLGGACRFWKWRCALPPVKFSS